MRKLIFLKLSLSVAVALLVNPCLSIAENLYHTSNSQELKFKLSSDKKDGPLRFEIENPKEYATSYLELVNPARAVIDIQGLKFKAPSKPQVKQNPYVKAIRFGAHPDHLRIVLDLNEVEGMQLHGTTNKQHFILEINSPQHKVVIQPTPAPASSSSAFSSKAESSSRPPVASSAANSSVAATSIASSTVSSANVAQTLSGLDAISFEYLEPEQAPILKLSVSCKPQFKLTKRDNRSYRIAIPDCGLGTEALSMPQFPPQDFVGFTYVKAQKQKNGVEVVVGVDRETRLTAFTKNQDIVLRVSK